MYYLQNPSVFVSCHAVLDCICFVVVSKHSLYSGGIFVVVLAAAAAADEKGVRGGSIAVQRGEGEAGLGLCS